MTLRSLRLPCGREGACVTNETKVMDSKFEYGEVQIEYIWHELCGMKLLKKLECHERYAVTVILYTMCALPLSLFPLFQPT